MTFFATGTGGEKDEGWEGSGSSEDASTAAADVAAGDVAVAGCVSDSGTAGAAGAAGVAGVAGVANAGSTSGAEGAGFAAAADSVDVAGVLAAGTSTGAAAEAPVPHGTSAAVAAWDKPAFSNYDVLIEYIMMKVSWQSKRSENQKIRSLLANVACFCTVSFSPHCLRLFREHKLRVVLW